MYLRVDADVVPKIVPVQRVALAFRKNIISDSVPREIRSNCQSG